VGGGYCGDLISADEEFSWLLAVDLTTLIRDLDVAISSEDSFDVWLWNSPTRGA
jgi:hypothetical protein